MGVARSWLGSFLVEDKPVFVHFLIPSLPGAGPAATPFLAGSCDLGKALGPRVGIGSGYGCGGMSEGSGPWLLGWLCTPTRSESCGAVTASRVILQAREQGTGRRVGSGHVVQCRNPWPS